MADTTASILVQLIDEASAGFQKIQKAGEEMARELSGNTQGLESMGQVVKDFTDPLVGGLNRSKKAAIGFESEMAEVAKVTGFSGKQIEEVARVTKGLSREIPMTTSGLNDIAVAAGQSGIALKDTKGFITDVAKAATAFYGGSSAKELEKGAKDAALAFGKITNVFDIPISEVSTLAAAINVLGDSSIASESDIIKAMTRTAGLGVQAKMTAKEMAALNASMISLGMAPQVAATATNALLSKMTTAEIQSARFQKGLEKVGISAAEMQNLVQSGGNNAIFALSDALNKLDSVQRSQAIGQLFGAEHSDNVGIFLERIDLYKQLLGGVANDQSNLNRYNKVYEAQLNTTASQLQILNNAYQELAIEIGTALLPAVKAFVKFLTPIIQGITDFAKKHPNIVRIGAALVGVAAAAGSAMLAIAAISRTWKGLQEGFPVLAGLADRFLGVGNPVSKFLNKMAGANQRLKETGKLTDKIGMPDLQMMGKIKDCLPICVCPELCDESLVKLKAQLAQIECLPICVYPEIHDLNLKGIKTSPENIADQQIQKSTTTQQLVTESTKTPADVAEQVKKRLSIPQVISLVAALFGTINAIKNLTNSNANLASKAVSIISLLSAANTANQILGTKEVEQQVGAKELTPITNLATQPQLLATTEAQSLQDLRIANAQELNAIELANIENRKAAEISQQQQRAAAVAAIHAAEIANSQQLQIMEESRIQARTIAQAQELTTATQIANLQLATATQIAAMQTATATQLTTATTQLAATATQLTTAATQLATVATQLGTAATQLGTAGSSAASEISAAAGDIAIAGSSAAAEISAAASQLAGIAGEITAAANQLSAAAGEIAASNQAIAEAPKREGGGFLKGAALLGGGALVGGGIFAASKAIGGFFGGITGAVGGAVKGVTGAVGGITGAVGGAVKGVTGAVGGIGGAISNSGPIGSAIAKSATGAASSISSAVGGATATAGTFMRGVSGVASSALKSAGTGVVGLAKGAASSAVSAAGGAIKGATASALTAAGGAIKGAATAAASSVATAPIVAGAGVAAASQAGSEATPTPKNTIAPFVRSSTPTPAAETAKEFNQVAPFSRGKAIASEVGSGIRSGEKEAVGATASMAKSISDYLPRSPAKVGPLSDIDKSGAGLTSEFVKGINSSAIQGSMESALNPPSMFGNLPFQKGGESTNNQISYAPVYNVSGATDENFFSELEKHDRKFMEWLERTQDRFSRGKY